MAINDWSAIQSLFDKLNKQLEKSQKVADQAVLPRVYIRLLVELEVCSLDCKLSLAATSACLLHCLQVCMCCERQVHAQPCCPSVFVKIKGPACSMACQSACSSSGESLHSLLACCSSTAKQAAEQCPCTHAGLPAQDAGQPGGQEEDELHQRQSPQHHAPAPEEAQHAVPGAD